MRICLFGASSNLIDQKYLDETEKLGELMGEAGHALVYGGGTSGLMGACARGVKRAGGYVIGVAPKLFNKAGILFPDFDEMFITRNLVDRKQKMMELAEVFVVAPGGIGTYDEMFEALANSQLGYTKKKVILFNIDGFFDDLVSFIKKASEKGFISLASLELYCTGNTPEEVMEILKGV